MISGRQRWTVARQILIVPVYSWPTQSWFSAVVKSMDPIDVESSVGGGLQRIDITFAGPDMMHCQEAMHEPRIMSQHIVSNGKGRHD